MKNYYDQIYEYLHRMVMLVIQEDRREIHWENGSVNLMENGLLKKLREQQGRTFQEIMDDTGRSRNEVTAMVRRLLKLQLIQKGPSSEDRRVSRLVLTDLGHQLAEDLEERWRKVLCRVLDEFSHNEEKAILKFLVKLDMLGREEEISDIRERVSAQREK